LGTQLIELGATGQEAKGLLMVKFGLACWWCPKIVERLLSKKIQFFYAQKEYMDMSLTLSIIPSHPWRLSEKDDNYHKDT